MAIEIILHGCKNKEMFAKNGRVKECKISFLGSVNIVLVMYVCNRYIVIHHPIDVNVVYV
jgi:hypothetical protein